MHGGPFANIAHGCNSVMATRAALKLADYVVTEAGFGADLGAEKFFDIKCRKAGLKPAATVLVATVRALKMHGGVAKDALGAENLPALEAGLSNLARHIANLRKFGVPVAVAINRFDSDTTAELAFVESDCRARVRSQDRRVRSLGARRRGRGRSRPCRGRARGFGRSEVSAALWRRDEFVGQDANHRPRDLWRGRHHGRSVGASEVSTSLRPRAGAGCLICVAKTQYSFSDDPSLLGAPSGHVPRIRDVRLRAGAGFVVVLMGDIRTMPGLPRVPAAERIRVVNGEIDGLT